MIKIMYDYLLKGWYDEQASWLDVLRTMVTLFVGWFVLLFLITRIVVVLF